MGYPNLLPNDFKISLHSGGLSIKFPLLTILRAEAAVKSMKKIIRTAWNGRFLDDGRLCKALLQYRNTPSTKDGLSPAQKPFGHPVQVIISAHPRLSLCLLCF